MKKIILLFIFFIFHFAFFILNCEAQTSDWLWAKGAGGKNNDYATSVAANGLGDVFVAGYFYSDTITFGSTSLMNNDSITNGTTDLFLAKYNATGSLLWAKSAGGNNNDFASSVVADASGNTYVCGYFYSDTISFGSTSLTNVGGNTSDLFLAKYDVNGNILWVKTAGGNNDDYATSIAMDALGDIYVTGYFYSDTITFGTDTLRNAGTYTNIFLAKYDVSGNVIWVKRAGGTSYDGATSVAVDASGNAYIAGWFNSDTITFGSTTLVNKADTTSDIFLAEYDANGNVQWAKSAGGTGNDAPTSIAVDASGNVYLAGNFYSNTITFGSTSLMNADTSGATTDLFLAKYNNSGNLIWAKSAGGTDDDISTSIALNTSGNIYVAGYFESDTITFGSTSLMNAGNSNVFVTKYNANGNALWTRSTAGTGCNYTFSLAEDISGNTYLAGDYQSSTLSFGTNMLTNADTSGNTYDIFLAKLSAVTGINEFEHSANITLYPNPANAQITIEAPQQSSVEIMNTEGITVQNINVNGNKSIINVSSLACGLYFVKIKTKEGVESRKFIKE